MDVELVSTYLWKTVPPFLLIVGVTGNVLAILVLKRLRFSRHPTLTFLMFLSVNDFIVLLTGLPRYWIKYVTQYDIATASNVNCKLYFFVIYLSMQFSSWILVGVTIERLVKTYFPFKYRLLYTSKRDVTGLLVVLIALVSVNGHFFFTNGVNEYTNGTCGSLTDQDRFFDEKVFVCIDFSLLCAMPFVIKLLSSLSLVRILRKMQLVRASMMHPSIVSGANKSNSRMTKMLVVCTFYFLFATAPVSIWFILDSYLTPGYKSKNNTAAQTRMKLARTITYLIQFTSYCINFYLYTAINDRFSKELKKIICCQNSFRCGMSQKGINGSVKVQQSTVLMTTQLDVLKDKDPTVITQIRPTTCTAI